MAEPAEPQPRPLWAAARRDLVRRAAQPSRLQPVPASRAGARPLGLRLRQLAGAAGILMASFVASRLLGLARNAVLAAYYGTSDDYAAYLAANNVADTVFQILAGGVMGAAFIPVFTRYLEQGDERGAWRLASSAINLAALLTGAVALVLVLLARPLAAGLAAGRDPAFQELTAALLRILLLAPVLFAVSAFLTSILNSFQRFFWAALAPLMYNLGIIAGAVLLHQRHGIYGVAIGVLAGAAGHLLIQVPDLLRLGARYMPVIDWRHAGVREVGRLMVPRMFALGVAQLNKLASVFFALLLAAGSLPYLEYAWLVFMVPLGVFGMAVSTAVFPSLARQSAAARHDELQALFSLSLRMILFLTVPAAVGLMVLGGPIVRLLFERGEFSGTDTRAVALALACYALGLPGHSLVEIVNRAFYALHDTVTPVKAAVVAVAGHLLLSIATVALAQHGALPPDRAYAGLALANAAAGTCEAMLLVGWLRRRLPGLALGSLVWAGGRYALAAGAMGVGLVLADERLVRLFPTDTAAGQLVAVGTLVALGAAGYGVLAVLLGSREPRLLLRLLCPQLAR
ncbi:MAG: murein biosynthesis integral membrane protein MurJ [Chloroflexi bacterium]|nr:murein biosynthesis integral membrane protein MurJ [Chloroflexota bacterium]